MEQTETKKEKQKKFYYLSPVFFGRVEFSLFFSCNLQLPSYTRWGWVQAEKKIGGNNKKRHLSWNKLTFMQDIKQACEHGNMEALPKKLS